MTSNHHFHQANHVQQRAKAKKMPKYPVHLHPVANFQDHRDHQQKHVFFFNPLDDTTQVFDAPTTIGD